MSQISVNIVTWNSMKYLPALLASLREQTFKNFSVLIIDNASSDGLIDFIREKYSEMTILRNFHNRGFSAAHNQGIRYARSLNKAGSLENQYVLVTNPDIILTPSYLEEIVAAAEKNPQAASFGGKLLRVEQSGDDGLEETITTDVIDTTGIRILTSRRVVERGAGEIDQKQFDNDRDVFGISGALVLYRLSALDAARIGENYFDENFFSYKEDIDLAWRLRLAGFGANYVPEAKAYHFRRAFGREKSGPFEFIRNRKTKSDLINFLSYRNHLLLLAKNDFAVNFFIHFLWIAPYEFGKWLSILVFEPQTLRAWFSFWKSMPRVLGERKYALNKAAAKPKEIRNWFK